MRKRLTLCIALILLAVVFREILGYAASLLIGGSLLAMLIHPIAGKAERQMGRCAALTLAWAVLLAVLSAGAAVLIPICKSQLPALGNVWTNLYNRAEEWMPAGYKLLQSAGLTAEISKAAARIMNCIGSGIGGVVESLSRIGMMWIVSLFLYMQKERYLLMGEMLLPQKYRAQFILVGSRILREVKLFIRAQTSVSFFIALLTTFGLLLIRMKGAILLGLLTGILNMIPYFGPIAAAVPVILSAFAGGWLHAAAAAGVLIGVQQIDSCLISPRILSGATGLSPLSVILSLAVGGTAFGIAGMLLAVPSAIAIRIVYCEWAQSRENRSE